MQRGPKNVLASRPLKQARSTVDICKSACDRRREATFVYKLLIDSKQSHVTGTAGGRTGRVVGGDPKLPRTGTAYRKNLIHLKVFFCKLRNKFPFPLATSLASQGDEMKVIVPA